jgi:hypothetical protein
VTRAPDLVEPVVAFRTWRVADGELVSPYLPERWSAGTVEARCVRGDPQRFRHAGELLASEHVSPHPACRCGIHAYLEPRSAVAGVDFRRVLGIVAVWGLVELHPEGLRAQFAQVRALGASAGWSSWHRRDVEAIAERLGVPVLPEEALAAAVAEFGSPVPARLRDPAAPA